MKCLFSGQDADNYEHVIPKWLQRKFNLFDQNIILPNGTTLPYRQICIPVLQKHNSNFGKIENNISQEIYKPEEIYLWALKIHLGLIFKDSSLKFERSEFDSPHILDTTDFDSEIAIFRHLYKIWLEKGTTNPSPIGTVFIIDSLYDTNEFDFFHCFALGIIGLNIGKKFILVFLWDQRDADLAPILKTWEEHHLPIIYQNKVIPDYKTQVYLAYHVWACEVAYFLHRNRRSFNFIVSENSLILIPPLNRTSSKAEDQEEYEIICRSFGLKVKYNNNGPHSYGAFTKDN